MSGGAERAVCAQFGLGRIRNVAGNVWHIVFVHIPGLSSVVPFGVELVVPGEVIFLQVVVGVLGIFERRGLSGKIILIP